MVRSNIRAPIHDRGFPNDIVKHLRLVRYSNDYEATRGSREGGKYGAPLHALLGGEGGKTPILLLRRMRRSNRRGGRLYVSHDQNPPRVRVESARQVVCGGCIAQRRRFHRIRWILPSGAETRNARPRAFPPFRQCSSMMQFFLWLAGACAPSQEVPIACC